MKVFFKKPTLGFIPTLGYHGSILISPKTLASPAAEQANLSKTSGSGPYVVDSWKEGDFVKLVKRKDYNWGRRRSAIQARPSSIASPTSWYRSRHSGLPRFNQAGRYCLQCLPAGTGIAEGGRLHHCHAPLSRLRQWLGVNTKLAPYDDVKVRQALQSGINRQEIIDTVYTPDWKLATSFIQSNVPGATDHSALLAYDPAKAEKLLDEAGWAKGADGIRTKDGKPLTLTLHSNPYLATSRSVDELVAQQLGKLGWKVDIRAYDVVTFGEKVKYGGPAVPAYEVTRSFIDAGTVASILTNANNGENWFALDEGDAKLNELRDKIASAGTLETRTPLLDELQKYILEQGYFIPRTQIVQRIYVQSRRSRAKPITASPMPATTRPRKASDGC